MPPLPSVVHAVALSTKAETQKTRGVSEQVTDQATIVPRPLSSIEYTRQFFTAPNIRLKRICVGDRKITSAFCWTRNLAPASTIRTPVVIVENCVICGVRRLLTLSTILYLYD